MPVHHRVSPTRPASGAPTEDTARVRRALPSPGEAEVLRVAARNAEDGGDFVGALRLVRRLPDGAFARRWREQLRIAARLPVSASAHLACWLVHPAMRWALERPAGDVLQRQAHLMLTTLGLPAPERVGQIAAAAATDPVVVDAGLFDGGLFGCYLAGAISPSLLARAGPVASWPAQPASIWRVHDHRADVAVVHDLWAGRDVQTMAWPSSPAVVAGALLYGRLVPVLGDIPVAFALPPVRVDQRCASRVLRARHRGGGPEERLRAVARFRRRQAETAGRSG